MDSSVLFVNASEHMKYEILERISKTHYSVGDPAKNAFDALYMLVGSGTTKNTISIARNEIKKLTKSERYNELAYCRIVAKPFDSKRCPVKIPTIRERMDVTGLNEDLVKMLSKTKQESKEPGPLSFIRSERIKCEIKKYFKSIQNDQDIDEKEVMRIVERAMKVAKDYPTPQGLNFKMPERWTQDNFSTLYKVFKRVNKSLFETQTTTKAVDQSVVQPHIICPVIAKQGVFKLAFSKDVTYDGITVPSCRIQMKGDVLTIVDSVATNTFLGCIFRDGNAYFPRVDMNLITLLRKLQSNEANAFIRRITTDVTWCIYCGSMLSVTECKQQGCGKTCLKKYGNPFRKVLDDGIGAHDAVNAERMLHCETLIKAAVTTAKRNKSTSNPEIYEAAEDMNDPDFPAKFIAGVLRIELDKAKNVIADLLGFAANPDDYTFTSDPVLVMKASEHIGNDFKNLFVETIVADLAHVPPMFLSRVQQRIRDVMRNCPTV